MRVVVSGASGFLGSTLVKQLLEDACEVVGLVFEQDALTMLRTTYANESATSFEASSDWDASRRALADADCLVHCAFPRAGSARALSEGMRYGSELMRAALEEGCRSVVNISSQSVYDPHRDYAATEGSPLVLETPYATAKYASELELEEICGSIPHVSVRLASLIGPGFNQRVPNKMAERALAGESIVVRGGNQVFDYMDGRDAASALAALAKSDASSWMPVYNVGSIQPRSLVEIAEMVSGALQTDEDCGKNSTITIKDDCELVPQSSALDANLFWTNLGWRPAYTIDSSVKCIVENLLSNHGN